MSRGFLETSVLGFSRALNRAMQSEKTARQRGLLQLLDPRVRVIGLFSLVLAAALAHKMAVIVALLAVALVFALLSKISLLALAARVWLVVLGFTGVIALPAILVTPGDPVAHFGSVTVTAQGLRAAAFLILRVETAVTLTTLLILSTQWTHVLKALRALRLPKEAVIVLAMSYRYVFLLVQTATQMFDSRRSRTVGVLAPAEQRKIAARTAGVLLSKSIATSNDVYLAMQSRGFRGDVQVISEFRMTPRDYAALLLLLLVVILALWAGR